MITTSTPQLSSAVFRVGLVLICKLQHTKRLDFWWVDEAQKSYFHKLIKSEREEKNIKIMILNFVLDVSIILLQVMYPNIYIQINNSSLTCVDDLSNSTSLINTLYFIIDGS